MAIGTTAAIIGGVSALGAIAGAAGGNRPDFEMGGQGALGTQGQNLYNQGGSTFGSGGSYAQQGLNTQASAFGQYGGLNDFSASRGASMDLASLLGQYQQSGGVPSQQDQQAAAGYANNQFAQQRVNLQQTFDQQMIDANRQAALSGRGGNDPILRAKLGQEQMRQTAGIDAAQQGFAGQYANQISQQRLGYAEGRTNVLTSMDSLNAQNRQQAYSNMFGLGGQQLAYGGQQQQMGLQQQQLGLNAMNQDWQQRMQAASGKFQADSQKKNAWDFIGAGIGGAVGGLGAGMSVAGALGGGASAASPFSGSLAGGSNPFSGSYSPSNMKFS